MPYLYLIGAAGAIATANILNACFGRKNKGAKNASGFYSLAYATFAFLCWSVLFCIQPSFDWITVWYAVGFAAFYLMGVSGYALAFKTGPVMLTSLFISLSLIGVTVWGFFFWNTIFSPLIGIGLALVVTAVTLCLYKGKSKKGEEQEKNTHSISLKWILFVLLAFTGNAGATIVQRTQQTACGGQHGSLLMFIATGLAAAVFAIVYVCKDASDFKKVLKTTGHFPMIAGVCNFALNFFVILLASSSLSPSLIYPVMSVGSLACITVASIFLFKEKMKWWQWLGVAIGAMAVTILSL